MDVPVKLLAYNVWAAEYDKTVLLSVGVDIFDWLYLKERPKLLANGANDERKYDKWG